MDSDPQVALVEITLAQSGKARELSQDLPPLFRVEAVPASQRRRIAAVRKLPRFSQPCLQDLLLARHAGFTVVVSSGSVGGEEEDVRQVVALAESRCLKVEDR